MTGMEHEDIPVESPKMSSKQLRKIRKPLIERRRRERINGCLTELKHILKEANDIEESRFEKLEKAELLEMAVNYLKTMQRKQVSVTETPQGGALVHKYTSGFVECAKEVERYLYTSNGVHPEVQTRIVGHLQGCMHRMQPQQQQQQQQQPQFTVVSNVAQLPQNTMVQASTVVMIPRPVNVVHPTATYGHKLYSTQELYAATTKIPEYSQKCRSLSPLMDTCVRRTTGSPISQEKCMSPLRSPSTGLNPIKLEQVYQQVSPALRDNGLVGGQGIKVEGNHLQGESVWRPW